MVGVGLADRVPVDRALARDRNFVTASIFGFFIGILLFSTMALLPPMMQGLMGNYLEQSKNLFVQMQEQVQEQMQTGALFPGIPGLLPKK